jgi:hypothetical protein
VRGAVTRGARRGDAGGSDEIYLEDERFLDMATAISGSVTPPPPHPVLIGHAASLTSY